ncbi:MAG: PfkB family carbohydrate kinase [Candidatus Rokuibacteriota bacterium]|jgi:sugar/nucleoside kinase (ribokinase family)
MSPVDFVAVGHVTLDQTARGTRPGGAAYYTAMTAHRLGLHVGLLTSFGPDFPRDALPAGIEVVNVSAERTTTFRIGQTGGRTRELAVLARAADLEAEALPEEWQDASLGALAPVTGEVDPSFAAAFPETSLVALPQGWMRQRGKGGILAPQPWEDADLVLPRVQALVVSHEDVEPFEKDAFEWFQQVPIGAVTHGAAGAILFVNGERYGVEPDVAVEKDGTGAGDVFAAALLIGYNRDGNAWDAAAAAACCAAASVAADGAAGIPDRGGLKARLAAYRRRHGI